VRPAFRASALSRSRRSAETLIVVAVGVVVPFGVVALVVVVGVLSIV